MLARLIPSTVALALLLVLVGCSAGTSGPGLYYCPMHPQMTSDRPGDCQICGMHLVQGSPTSAGAADPSSPTGLVPIEIPPDKRGALGITFGLVEKRDVRVEVNAPVEIVADETRIFRVVSRVEGYIDGLRVPYAGATVRKDQVVLSIYSPNLLATQQQFIGQGSSDTRRGTAATSATATNAPEISERDEAFRQRLRYWGFADSQIDRLQSTGKAESSLEVAAPATGFVTEKNAVLGQRVTPGDTLLVITDLSVVWAVIEVSEKDVPVVRPGLDLNLSLAALPGRSFSGKVKFFQPVLDPQTRTMRVFAEVRNARTDLKPGMIGTAELSLPSREGLVVPEGAILRSGETSYAFVEDADGRLVPTAVALGARGRDGYEVLSGLTEGERVATSAAFLLDSESSLKAALEAMEAR